MRLALALALAGLTLLLPDIAAADRCLDQVKGLAAEYGVSTDPPTVDPKGGRTAKSDDLAKSGGVIEPPQTQDRSVISPPAQADSRMPTVPDVVPRTNPPAEKTVTQTSLQALLVAARAQAERGEEAQCLARLQEARAMAAKIAAEPPPGRKPN